MPYNADLDRNYTKEEARLWREVQFQDSNSPYTPRSVQLGRGMGISEQQVRQYLRTWENDNLCRVIDIGTGQVTLTPFGRDFRFERRYSDIE